MKADRHVDNIYRINKHAPARFLPVVFAVVMLFPPPRSTFLPDNSFAHSLLLFNRGVTGR